MKSDLFHDVARAYYGISPELHALSQKYAAKSMPGQTNLFDKSEGNAAEAEEGKAAASPKKTDSKKRSSKKTDSKTVNPNFPPPKKQPKSSPGQMEMFQEPGKIGISDIDGQGNVLGWYHGENDDQQEDGLDIGSRRWSEKNEEAFAPEVPDKPIEYTTHGPFGQEFIDASIQANRLGSAKKYDDAIAIHQMLSKKLLGLAGPYDESTKASYARKLSDHHGNMASMYEYLRDNGPNPLDATPEMWEDEMEMIRKSADEEDDYSLDASSDEMGSAAPEAPMPYALGDAQVTGTGEPAPYAIPDAKAKAKRWKRPRGKKGKLPEKNCATACK